MKRRDFLGATAGAAWAAPIIPRKPNIVLILADDLGYGDLGCYGQQRIKTPHIDRLAAEGMRFRQAYAGSTVCAPSRCVLMTGKHTGHSTVRGNRNPELPLEPGEATIATVLKAAGYRTAIFGKWGLGGPQTDSLPDQKGFDEFYGYLNHWHAHLAYPEHIWHNRNEVLLFDNWFHQCKSFVPGHFIDRALKFIEGNASQPFFIYLATTIPHANNELKAMEVPGQGMYAGEKWPEVEKNFAAAVTLLDSGVGRILELLKQKGLDQDTLVLFTSDNGPHGEGGHDAKFFQSSGPLRGKKRDLYEGGIRVPAIARWPGKIKPGAVNDFPWAFWDLLPTFAEVAGTPAPRGLDGVSILPTLLGRTQRPHDFFYWEFHEGGFQQAVRQGKWKLVRQLPRMEFELFDLNADVGETRDVAAANPGVVTRMQALLREARIESAVWPSSGPRPPFQER